MASLLASCFGAGAREASEPLLLAQQHQQQQPQENPLLQSPPIPRRQRANPATATANAHANDNDAPDDTIVPDVWILAGQSNCTGWNGPDGTQLDPLPHPPSSSILMLTADGGALVRAQEPTHLGVWGLDDRQCVGPGLSFACALREGHRRRRRDANLRPVVLVPCARGGSSLWADWAPDADDGDGTALDTRSGSLFGNCVRRTLRAVDLATVLTPSCSSSSSHGNDGGNSGGGGQTTNNSSQHGRPRVRGMVWVQGESDGMTPQTAVAYVSNFGNFLRRLREALAEGLGNGGGGGSGAPPPTTPAAAVLPIVLMVVMAAREREKAFPYIRLVREAQLWIANKAAQDREMSRRRRGGLLATARGGSGEDGDRPFAGVWSVDMAGFEFFPDGGSAAHSAVAVDGNLVHLTKDGAVALGTALGLLGAAAEEDEDDDEEARRRRR